MKVFISWSGELSKKIADSLNNWIPCILQTVEVFYSPEDIEKGENWDKRLSAELSDCNFGIICLTPENNSAPWINFEAGSIAKDLNARISALMININPSDIKGPLSRYQATKIEKDDFYHLIQSINKQADSPIDEKRLSTTFDAVWPRFEEDIKGIIHSTPTVPKVGKKAGDSSGSDATEEILQLVRKQNTMLSSPESLLPSDYLASILESALSISSNNSISNNNIIERLFRVILDYLDNMVFALRNSSLSLRDYVFQNLGFDIFLSGIHIASMRLYLEKYDPSLFRRFIKIHSSLISLRDNNNTTPDSVSLETTINNPHMSSFHEPENDIEIDE